MSALTFSDATDKIIPALAILQENLGEVKKNATNPHFKSKYADLGAVLEAIWPATEAAKLVLLQPPTGEVESNGDYYVTIETWLVHAPSGQSVHWTFKLPTAKDDPQGAGSAITYGRRYSLTSFLGIAPEDDDGNAGSKGTSPKAFSRPAVNAAPTPSDKPASGGKIPPSQLVHFTAIDIPPAEAEAIVKTVQAHFHHPATGKLTDLYEGDEARDAYTRLKKFADGLVRP